MIPQITLPFGTIPTFALFISLGVLTFIFILHVLLKGARDRGREEEFILIRLVVAGGAAWFFAGLFDAIFKYVKHGHFEWKGITFYGGLIGYAICMALLLRASQKSGKTQYSVREWFDLQTLPLIGFHFFGRLGCFFGGCCFGKVTDSSWGVVFPDQIEQGIIHNGVARYPTQLFEAVLLLIIFGILLFIKSKVCVYLLCYSVGRFIIEFYRGDDRGSFLSPLSPAQVISIVLFVFVLGFLIKERCVAKQKKRSGAVAK